jgi:hypothetical protein
MSRVSKESLEKLNAFIDSLPVEARNKCALCNETLVHLVKTAEVESGAGTATVTRALADRINEDAAPGDRVTGKQLQDRARYHDGSDKIGNSENNPQPQHDQPDEKESERPVVENKPSAQLKNWRENKAEKQKELFPMSVISKSFEEKFHMFFEEMLRAKNDNWETTSKEAASQCLKNLKNLIGE